jgi:hypothetical protein
MINTMFGCLEFVLFASLVHDENRVSDIKKMIEITLLIFFSGLSMTGYFL